MGGESGTETGLDPKLKRGLLGEFKTALHLKNWSLLYSTEGLAITKATTTLG